MSELQQANEFLEPRDSVEKSGDHYLSFMLGDEAYGVEILRVQEIKAWQNVTLIPNTPDYVCGVLNLRGAIIPVVDLRRRLDMTPKPYISTTVVIVLKVEGMTSRIVGIVVDAVSDAINVTEDMIRPTPDFGTHLDTHYIKGLVPNDNNMMMLLNIDHLLSVEALG
ncbi:MAG: chemotaxis protein CheW [Gammaproteobacteria bacterium]|nr:chemotaxis protein CheW [Gammaproteobacteria bacterium]